MWSHWSAWLPPGLLFIGEKHASHQVQPLLDQDYRPFLHMSSQTILCHHGWMPVKAKKLNTNSRHKYVVFFQEVPGGWTTCWPLYWVLLLRPAWLWYGGYGMVCYGMGGFGKLSYFGDTSPFGGFKHLNRAFHGLLTIWFVRDENGNINTPFRKRWEWDSSQREPKAEEREKLILDCTEL